MRREMDTAWRKKKSCFQNKQTKTKQNKKRGWWWWGILFVIFLTEAEKAQKVESKTPKVPLKTTMWIF